MGEFTVREVARIFDLQEARLRYWAQTGFVGPSVRRGHRAFYTFEDLLAVKMAKELLEAGLPLQRVRKNLDALRAALPQLDRPLTRLKIACDGDRVVVVADDVAFEPTTGQLRLQFDVASLDARIAEVLELPRGAGQISGRGAEPTSPAAEPPPPTAYAAFQQGLRAEDAGDAARAEALYRRALDADASFAAAWTNLGNVLAARGARGEAREAYERALALDPEQPEARFNLANLLADVGEIDLALAECRRVTTICPEFADAHYNLALLYARVGSIPQAKSHLLRYLELDGESEWADRARAFLAELR